MKKPKQPKMSSSIAVWQRWEQRMKEYERKKKEKREAPAKKRAIKNKFR